MTETMCVSVRFFFFYRNISPSRSVAGVAQGADLGMGLLFKVQLHILNTHMTSSWGQDSKTEMKSIKPRGHHSPAGS